MMIRMAGFFALRRVVEGKEHTCHWSSANPYPALPGGPYPGPIQARHGHSPHPFHQPVDHSLKLRFSLPFRREGVPQLAHLTLPLGSAMVQTSSPVCPRTAKSLDQLRSLKGICDMPTWFVLRLTSHQSLEPFSAASGLADFSPAPWGILHQWGDWA